MEEKEKAMLEASRGLITTPSENRGLKVRIAYNCPWNECMFCGCYKGKSYQERPLQEILKDIQSTQGIQYSREEPFKSAFLQDANALMLPTSDLIAVLAEIKQLHPHIERIASYGRNESISEKSPGELRELRDAGLTAIYCGLESGYDPLLEYMRKGTTAGELIRTGLKIKASGVELNEFVMPGLAGNLQLDGQETWRKHVEETARVVNEIDPDWIRLRTLHIYPNTPLWTKRQVGEFQRLTDPDIVRELRIFIEKLDRVFSNVSSNYVSNVLLEIEGKLPEDKRKMLTSIDRYLSLSTLEQYVFRSGIQVGIRTLDEFEELGAIRVLEMFNERFLNRFGSRYI